jgi:hypothetical protein
MDYFAKNTKFKKMMFNSSGLTEKQIKFIVLLYCSELIKINFFLKPM